MLAFELDRAHDVVDQLVPFGGRSHPQVEVRQPHQFFDVGTADQRATHQRHLLVDVRLDRESGEQRAQQRFRIDVDTRAGFVFFGNLVDDRDTDERGDPCRGETDPAAMPHAAQIAD